MEAAFARATVRIRGIGLHWPSWQVSRNTLVQYSDRLDKEATCASPTNRHPRGHPRQRFVRKLCQHFLDNNTLPGRLDPDRDPTRTIEI